MGRPPAKYKQRQIAIALPPTFRERLEQAASASEHSIAEEVRQRLEQSFGAERLDEATRDLLLTIQSVAKLVRSQTGYDWFAHPRAWEVFRHAINVHLDRLRPTEAVTEHPAALRPCPLVSSDNAEVIGAGLEAINMLRRNSVLLAEASKRTCEMFDEAAQKRTHTNHDKILAAAARGKNFEKS
jgi:hypothetical protein